MKTPPRPRRAPRPLLILAGLVFASPPVALAQTTTSYKNPLITTGNADPSIVFNNGAYYLYTTGDNKTYKYHESTNLVSWQSRNTTIWTPGDGTQNIWAPDIKYYSAAGSYVLYFAKNFYLGAATGSSPKSSFTTVNSAQFPLINGAIDAFGFTDWDGKTYLYYAFWSNAAGWTEIMGRELPTPTSWTGPREAHRLMLRYSGSSEGEHPGNNPLVEGPEVWRDRDTYYLIYSNSDWATPNYRACYATARHPLGPWVKAPNNPLIARDDAKGIYGPGHGGNFTDATGRLWHMYQQRPDATNSTTAKRQLCIDPLDLDPATRLLSLTPTRNVTVAAGPKTTPGNTAHPVVSLTAPAYGAVLAPGANLAVNASATDANGTIAKVDLYFNNTLVATKTAAPYSHTLLNLPAGVHWLEAAATDNHGAVAKARAVKIVVGNQPPVVTALRPATEYAGAGRPELIVVNAADPDGSVAQVDFYADGVLLGTRTAPPYSLTHTLANKAYVLLKAVATDNQGATGEFAWPVYPWSKSAQTAYKGVKQIPGSWEAEDFDAITDPANPGAFAPDPQYNAAGTYNNPGRNISFYKRVPGWSGASNYRPNTWVSLPNTTDSSGGGQDISEIENDDWFEYSCNVASAGAYSLVLRLRSSSAANEVLVTVDGVDVAGGFRALPDTGNAYQDITLAGLQLPSAGAKKLRLSFRTTADKTLRLNRLSLAGLPSAAYAVSGTVTLGGSGLSGVEVSDGARSALTAANGSYTLSGVPDGSYTLVPSLAGHTFTPTHRSVVVAGAPVGGQDFVASAPAPAAPAILYEGFNYTVGSTAPDPDGGANSGQGLPASNAGGSPAGVSTGLRGAWGSMIEVVPGLSYSAGGLTLASSGGAARATNATWGVDVPVYQNMAVDPHVSRRLGDSPSGAFGKDGQTLWFSFLARSSSATPQAWRLSLGGTARNLFVENTATGWTLNDNASGPAPTSAPLALDTPALIVVRLSLVAGAGDVASLWINPSLDQPLGAPQASVTTAGDYGGFARVNTRPAIASAMTFDEFRMGPDADSVLPLQP